MKIISLLLTFAAVAAMAEPVFAAAPSEQVARVCRQKAIEAYPTPRIGTMHGAATAQREFFRDCAARMQEEQGN